MTLSKEGYYFYTDRVTYEAAVLLNNKFSLEQMLEETDSEINKGMVEWLADSLPKPLSILAPLITILEDELEQDLEECIKAIHVITNVISPYNYLGVRKELRKSVTFSLSVLDEAELSTELFLSNTFELEKVKELFSTPQPQQVVYAQPMYEQQQPSTVYSPPVIQANTVKELDIETATLEDFQGHPDWEECGPGVFYHHPTGNTAFVDVPEDDEFLDDINDTLSGNSEEDATEETQSTDKSSLVQPEPVSAEEAQGVKNLIMY